MNQRATNVIRRPVFLVNVPGGTALLWLAWRYLPGDAGRMSRRGRAPLDLTGMAALSAAMLLLVLPLVLGQDEGWPPWTWLSLAASAAAFAVLWRLERSVAACGGRPLVDPGLLARPAIGWGLASQAAATGSYFAILFTLALYLQQGLGKSAAYSGLALLSWVAAFGIPGPLLGRLPVRARALAAPIGAVLLAAAFAGIGISLLAGGSSGALLMTLLGAGGLGLGIVFTGVLGHLTSSVTAEHAADVSGLFNTAARSGGVIGTAAFGTLYLALARSSAPSAGQATHGFAVVNLALAGTALAAAVLAAASVRQPSMRNTRED